MFPKQSINFHADDVRPLVFKILETKHDSPMADIVINHIMIKRHDKTSTGATLQQQTDEVRIKKRQNLSNKEMST